ncbi:MAG: orotidine 5'-phosphate decarboxylase [Candidatus Nezhaarchaeota archaeon]|nr:orotidine 5'-phosphate decarboxylase [Candidatus Nezhaarchaeota archaeon]
MAGSYFLEAVERASTRNGSRIVLALDVEGPKPLERAEEILEEAGSFICSVKVNKHLVLPQGLRAVKRLVERAHELGLPAIADCKSCDIGSTNRVEASLYFEAGFDALTVMPLAGWSQGLEEVFKLAEGEDRGILAVAYMSHRGAEEFFNMVVYDEELGSFDKLHRVFLRRALRWGADGFIVGATRPEAIAQAKNVVGGKPIFSPGAVAQGGNPVEAVRAGASYVIVGRAICASERPGEKAREIRDAIQQLREASRGRA